MYIVYLKYKYYHCKNEYTSLKYATIFYTSCKLYKTKFLQLAGKSYNLFKHKYITLIWHL